jgi:hypothetical protein
MDEITKQEMANDIELCKNMASVGNAKSILELTNHLIGYLEIVNQAIAEAEFKASQLKGKKRTLEEYVRSSKDFAKNVGINEYFNEKK